MTTGKYRRLGGAHPRLGLLVDWLEDGYQSTILRGAIDAARERRASLTCFTGGILGSPDRGAPQRNHVFDLASAASVDALMILSGTMGNHVGPEELAKFCERFRPMPMCSLAIPLPGLPSVLVDNANGMHTALAHMISVHGHKRIAFVRGPTANDEAERRFDAYRATLAEHRIDVDPRLVTLGDFQPESGAAAVKTLFDERRIEVGAIQAIVAANDLMAMGVLGELGARGIAVPDRIAVVGFDDVEDVRYTRPALTTVRQPLYEQGRQAVRLVLDELQSKRRSEDVVLNTELIIRRSCGCYESADRDSQVVAPSRHAFEAAIVERRQVILADLTRTARGALSIAGAGWEVRLLNAFSAEVLSDRVHAFRDAFEQIVDRVVAGGVDMSLCQALVSTLRRQVLACLANEPERRAHAEDLFQEVRIATSAAIERAEGRERLRVERWARTLSETGAAIIATFDLAELVSAVSLRFPRLGIRGCYVALYEESTVPPDQSRLVLAYGGAVSTIHLGAMFTSKDLLPEWSDDGREGRSVVVAPLFFRDEVLGFVVLELDVGQGFAFEALRELFSAALKGAKLVDQVREAETARANATARLESASERSEAIGEAVRRLKKAIELAREAGAPFTPEEVLGYLEESL